jgi:hypothetical protein
MDIAEWSRLLTAVQEIQEWFPEGVAYIGGIAVFAHASAEAATAKYAGMSHDADLMILLPDFADLRDIEALTPNRRLGKQQFSRDGFEFDVYVEGQHNLPVPADEAVAWAQMKNGLRVACAEHLLILKLKAFEDRKGTGKGAKDEDDVLRLLLVRSDWRKECLSRMTDDMLRELDNVVKGDAPVRLVSGNFHEAKSLRGLAIASVEAIKAAYTCNYEGGSNGP